MSYHLLNDYEKALQILEEFRKTQQVRLGETSPPTVTPTLPCIYSDQDLVFAGNTN